MSEFFKNPEINFKRVSGGWVFRAPNPWIFGNSPHYLVSDDQKVRITAVHRALLTPGNPMLVAIGISAAIAWAVAVALVIWAFGSGQANQTARDLGLMSCILVPLLAGISGLHAIHRRRLKPILADASLTNERITYAEMRKAAENSTPPKQARLTWITYAFTGVVFAGVIIMYWVEKQTIFELWPSLFTFILLFSAWQAARWYRISQRQAKQEQ